jgi:prolyl oligopeptidase
VHLVDLADRMRVRGRCSSGRRNDWSYLGNPGSNFFFRTNFEAPRQRVVAMDFSEKENPRPREVIAQRDALLSTASMVGGKLIVTYPERRQFRRCDVRSRTARS